MPTPLPLLALSPLGYILFVSHLVAKRVRLSSSVAMSEIKSLFSLRVIVFLHDLVSHSYSHSKGGLGGGIGRG